MYKRFEGIIGIGILSLAMLFVANPQKAFALQAMPMTTTSYYVETTNTETDAQLDTWMYWRGYELGQQTQATSNATDNAVILEFGQPRIIGGVYGASGYKGSGYHLTMNSIGLASLYFAYGYWDGVGSRMTPLRMILSTNNSGINNLTDSELYNHGQAWINMVKTVQSSVQYYGWNSKVSTYGGNDMEIGYATPSKTMQWVNGYNSQYSDYFYLFDIGDAAGCPLYNTTNVPAACPTTPVDYGWTQEDKWNVAWGSYSYPLPEIYSTAGGNARQWQQLSLYSYLAHGGPMFITGPLTQSQACAQRGGCSGVDNTPSQAWGQIWNRLSEDWRTAQDLLWSTDITHKLP